MFCRIQPGADHLHHHQTPPSGKKVSSRKPTTADTIIHLLTHRICKSKDWPPLKIQPNPLPGQNKLSPGAPKDWNCFQIWVSSQQLVSLMQCPCTCRLSNRFLLLLYELQSAHRRAPKAELVEHLLQSHVRGHCSRIITSALLKTLSIASSLFGG